MNKYIIQAVIQQATLLNPLPVTPENAILTEDEANYILTEDEQFYLIPE